MATKKMVTMEEVNQHNSESDCWMVIGAKGQKKVYDVTKFLDDHPGGPEIMLDLAGQDADDEFEDIGHSNDARKQLEEFLVADLKEDEKTTTATSSSTATTTAKQPTDYTFLFVSALVVLIFAIVLKFSKQQ